MSNKDEVSDVTLDDNADTPDTRVVTRDPTKRRATSGKKVYVHHKGPDIFDVLVDAEDDGLFEERNLSRREVELYLRGVDAGVAPDNLELPEGWRI